jgi:hypothetical protein
MASEEAKRSAEALIPKFEFERVLNQGNKDPKCRPSGRVVRSARTAHQSEAEADVRDNR